MAVESRPNVRGFPVQLDIFDADCFSTDAAVASAIVANDGIAGVIGHACSAAFAPVLPLYEAAGVVTISGSATAPYLPPFGPTVFNRVVVADDEGADAWITRVEALPSVRSWQQDYAREFGEPPITLAEFYYDATLLLLRRIHEVAKLDRGSLVIDRAALAAAVRSTTDFRGVSCSITLKPNGNRVNDPAALDRCAKQTG
jgi:ABC-type branched-subunit amino acid transport system substrate-binding protein